jgi:hypothetical protein
MVDAGVGVCALAAFIMNSCSVSGGLSGCPGRGKGNWKDGVWRMGEGRWKMLAVRWDIPPTSPAKGGSSVKTTGGTARGEGLRGSRRIEDRMEAPAD